MIWKTLSLAFMAIAVSPSMAAEKGMDAPPTRESLEFFEAKIRPVLSQQCYRCHSAETKSAMGGFRLDTREAIRAGGQSGPAVVAGQPGKSLLLKALHYDGRKMPPGGQLAEEVVNNFEKWIAMGAPDPREGEKSEWKATSIDVKKGRDFWAFQTVKKPAVPAAKNSWAKTNLFFPHDWKLITSTRSTN